MIKPYSFPILIKLPTIRLTLFRFSMVCFFLFNGLFMVAQESTPMSMLSTVENEWCVTNDTISSERSIIYSGSVNLNDLNDFNFKVLNVFYWNIVKDDGSGSPELIENDYLRAHNDMNEAFADYNICFNLLGYETVRNSTYELWPSTQITTLINHMKSIGKYNDDAINIYLYRSSQAAGVSSSKNAIGVGKWQFKDDPESQILIHEMGHQLGLPHTHIGWISSSCEHVTRDNNAPNYNASGSNSRGDRIHDTNAVPDFASEQRDHARKALRDGGFTSLEANSIINNDNGQGNSGFSGHPQENLIENILLNYGFTTIEVNQIKQNGTTLYAYTNLNNCSYVPDSRINDLNSPFFKDCEGTPYLFFAPDVRNYMSYVHKTCQNQFTVGQGIRMHEYIEADNSGYFLDRFPQHTLDLYVRDHEGDIGQEPNIHTEVFWHSPDIWVRNYADNGQTHQNPNYATNPNYVYVRVKNKSCTSSTGNETLELRWAKADTGIGGAALWTGTATGGPNNVPLGGLAGTLNIPVIAPGDEAVLQFTWAIPNPEDYFGITVDDWHYCLMTRIIATNDPMASPNHPWDSRLNNNIASKNVTVVNTAIPPTGKHNPGGTVSIGNISGVIAGTFGFDFFTNETGSAIFEEAEIRVTLSNDAFERWMMGGSQTEGIRLINEEKREFKITGNNARLNNMQYGPGEWSTLYLSFNFLTEEVTGKDTFEYHLMQRNAVTGDVVGGEVFQIIRNPERELFTAQGNSYENTNGEIEMVANDIGEPAIYNWYAPEGDLIYSGKEFTFFPEIPGDYLLEVIAETDGHKDYFNLTLAVNAAQDQIISLSPNPASNAVEAQYQISTNATNASLNIVSFFGNINTNHPIDLNNTGNTLNINLNGYPAGHYAVILQINGQAVHAKQLIIN